MEESPRNKRELERKKRAIFLMPFVIPLGKLILTTASLIAVDMIADAIVDDLNETEARNKTIIKN